LSAAATAATTEQAPIQAASGLRAWFDRAPIMMAQRQLSQASQCAWMLSLEIGAIRLGHTGSANRASQAMDQFVCAAHSTLELVGPADADERLHAGQAAQAGDSRGAYEAVLAMQANFQAQERAWSAGRLSSTQFLLGHETLLQDALRDLEQRLHSTQEAAVQRQPRADVRSAGMAA
jgi:hypothetical protein